ncbi:voltage-gated potassium channel [Parvibaculum indicum]|uniref:potassium channel family protein n=1 Tax=Parvibaculum indicum TaxID=562969 RepID=UPI0014208D5B|nr:potassium channel family protein [Parvibaculum indicum]NIJ42068.1 voltage-gated potassium channel [Parvibaculum indicum]
MLKTSHTLKAQLRTLYLGNSRRAAAFRYALLAFDVVTIGFFVVSSFMDDGSWMIAADLLIGAVLAVDFAARLIIARNKWQYLVELETLADIIVIFSLLSVAIAGNFAFLRVLRSLRLLRSYHVLREVRQRYAVFVRHEAVIQAIVNLLVFIFVVTAVVYVIQQPINPGIGNYIDALYFTVTTLTTTGFGDITLTGTSGRLLAVIIMVFGVALFLRLAQTIFRPQKVKYTCPDCGLNRHDPDAVHCKHCGRVIMIETEGE